METTTDGAIHGILRSAFSVWVTLAVFFPLSADDTTALVTGKKLLEELDRGTAIRLDSYPVGKAIERLQDQSGICFVLDRRIDPSSPITLNSELIPTRQLLGEIARRLPESAAAFHRDFVYIGPVATARSQRTLIEMHGTAILSDRDKFPEGVYAQLSESRSCSWPELSAPRNLLVQQAEICGLTIENPLAIPHDLWRSGSLPPLTFSEQATVLLSQFDLSFRINPKNAQCTIVAMPDEEEIVIEKRHTVRGKRRQEIEEQISKQFTDVDIHWDRTSLRVRGTLELHEEIAALIDGSADDRATGQ